MHGMLGVRECECLSDRGPVFPGGGRAPRARAVTHGHGPPLVGKQHGLYVVDVGDGEWAPVFSYDHSQARDRTRRGGRPDRSPFEVQGTAPGLQLSGVGLHWGKRFTAEHGDTVPLLCAFAYVACGGE